MLSIRVLLGVLSVLGLASVSSAQTFACGGAGYNLATIGDLNITSGGYTWSLNPCRPLTSGACAGKNATFCQASTPLNFYNPFINVVTWTTITGGIMSRAINGNPDGCALGTSVRTGSVQYFCNAAATTAFISNVEEVQTCQYLAQVQTSLVCAAPVAVTSEPVGLPFSSNTCGGGLFDLTSIDIRDYSFNDGNGNSLIYRPCSPINSSTSCAPGTSFCQSSYYALSAGNGLAQTYTLQADGVIIQSQDGLNCGGGGGRFGWPREANVYLQCNASATTPYYVPGSFFEGEVNNFPNTTLPNENPNGNTEPSADEYCHYTIIIQTAAVCNRITASTAVVPSIPAPVFACGGAGYDLTLLSAVDMTYGRGSPYNDVFFVNPCRPVTQGPCAGQGATVCQGNLTTGNGAVLAYYQPVYAPIQWSTTTYNGSLAVQSYSLYGDLGSTCAQGTSSATVVYFCSGVQGGNAYGRIYNITQTAQCQYTIYVATTVVCGTALARSTAVGYSFNSNTCGGGLYNLAALDSRDFQFNTSSSQAYWWRPCSVATSFICASVNASFCQSSGSSSANALAVPAGLQTNSVTAVNTYTLQSNGLLIQSQDGTLCGSIPRAASTYLVCNSSATTPYVLSFSENNVGTIAGYLNNGQAYCHYELVLATNQVCASTVAPSTSSSSGASAAPSSASSSGSSSSAAAGGGGGGAPGASSSAGLRSSSSAAAASSSASIVSSSSSSSTSVSIVSSSSSSAAVAPARASSSSSSSSTGTSSSSSGSSVAPLYVTSASSSSSSSSAAAQGIFSSSSALPPSIPASGASATSAVSAMLVAVVVAMMAMLL